MINNEIKKGDYCALIAALLNSGCTCLCGEGGAVSPSEIITAKFGGEMTSLIKTLSDYVYGDSRHLEALNIRTEEDDICAPLKNVVEVIEKMAASGLIKII